MRSSDTAFIVPTYNEAKIIRAHLRYHRDRFDAGEIVVVDGGSTDGTPDRVRELEGPIRLIHRSPANRSRQLAQGVRVAGADWLVFLHADTRLPRGFDLGRIPKSEPGWGWFDVRLDEPGFAYELIGRAISLRSRIFSSPTGDQALWVHRSLLEDAGGVPDLPLMEDVELSQRLRRRRQGTPVDEPVTTSARRWQKNGIARTVLAMWALKLAYLVGVPPRFLARFYR